MPDPMRCPTCESVAVRFIDGCMWSCKTCAYEWRTDAKHKYGAKPTVLDGVRYASKMEALRAQELTTAQGLCDINRWERQVPIRLGDIKYVADFEVWDHENRCHVEDVKGVETPQFRTIIRLWRKYGMVPLAILKRVGGKWSREWVPGMLGDAQVYLVAGPTAVIRPIRRPSRRKKGV